MDEQVVALAMVQAQTAVEGDVLGRQLEALRIRILVVEEAVARERARAAVHEEGVAAEVGAAAPAEEVEEHRLVVPEQEHALALAGEREQPIDDAPRVRTAIDVVPDEDEAVARLVRDPGEEFLQHLRLAVDVADRVEQGGPPPLPSS